MVLPPPLHWDIFCRVIDNHGDLGVCWRLSEALAARGAQVRLWVDRADALAWMAPGGRSQVQVFPWRDPQGGECPGDVVIEAFGCDPPPAFVERMRQRTVPPVWINLEYLSAEPYVERAHGLASPQLSGPGRGLTKWFFFPGFTPRTGGLLREADLPQRQSAFDRTRGLAELGVNVPPGAAVVLLFTYANPALLDWLKALAQGERPTLLLVPPGPAAEQTAAWLHSAAAPGGEYARGRLTLRFLPYVAQRRFDELLWATDLNLVRGEDSLVRALWAAVPFVWQLYPQSDGAHHAKLAAFLDRYLDGAGPEAAAPIRRLHNVWNGVAAPDGPITGGDLQPAAAWQAWARQIAARWAALPELSSELLHFARRHAGGAAG